MGDRAAIVVDTPGAPPLYLYTHWEARGVPDVVAFVLAREDRWNDPVYLARMLFCKLVEGSECGTTGFGIGTIPPAGARLLHVFVDDDPRHCAVRIGPTTWPADQFMGKRAPPRGRDAWAARYSEADA